MLDTHCHVDLYEDSERVVDLCEDQKIYTIAVTNAPSVFAGTERLVDGLRYVRPAVGIHPELAAQRRGELPLMWEALERTRYVGEVGLDYAAPEHERRVQRSVFSDVLSRCHDLGNKILTVHSRRAAEDVVDAIGDGFRGRVILHWYSGPREPLRRGVEAGCFFSVNPAMTKSRRFPSILREIPRERILPETDGPFVSVQGRPAVPSDSRLVISRLGELWGIPESKTEAIIMANFRRLLQPTTSDAKAP